MNTLIYENMPFCLVCQHRVQDMERHLQTNEHKRQEKRENGELVGYGARTPTGRNHRATGSRY